MEKSFHYENAYLLEELFSYYPDKIKCCPCLNKDTKAQKEVYEHNQKHKKTKGMDSQFAGRTEKD